MAKESKRKRGWVTSKGAESKIVENIGEFQQKGQSAGYGY